MHNYSNYLGIPYKIEGRNKFGIDCYGCIYLIYKDLYGIELPDFRGKEYQGEFSKLWKPILKEEIREKDVILFRTSRTSSAINHVALYIGEGRMIQCLENSSGIAIDRLERPYFIRHYYKSFRYKDFL